MSMALKQSKLNAGASPSALTLAQMQGDPGLFGFLGKAIKTVSGFVPGPIGTISRTLFPTRPTTTSPVSQRPVSTLGTLGPSSPDFRTPTFFPGSLPPQEAGLPAGQPRPGARAAGERLIPGGRSGLGTGCAAGFHPNKTAYWTKADGFVEVGTKCVRNRRRNPLNARAASRAIARLESAKKATKRINRISIRSDTPTKTRTVVKCFRCGNAQGRCTCP